MIRRGWLCCADRDLPEIHIVPVMDLDEHALRSDCWCYPVRLLVDEDASLRALMVHQALDGRDLVEASGVN